MTGKILDFRTHPGSGLAELMVEESPELIRSIPCDAGATARALQSAFGDNLANMVGQFIDYDVDEVGVLSYIVP